MGENTVNEESARKTQQKQKKKIMFQANNTYFTISAYAIGVIFVGTLIIRVFLSWDDTVNAAKQIINVLLPFIIGALIAFILNPATVKLNYFFEKYLHIKNRTLRKVLSIAAAYLLVIGLIAVVIFGIVPQVINSITDLVNYIPTAVNELYYFIDNLEEYFPDLDVDVVKDTINDAIPDVVSYIRDLSGKIVPALYQASRAIIQGIWNLIIAIIVSVYIISDKKPLKNSLRAVVYAFIPVKHIRTTVEILKEGYKLFKNFIVGKALDSAIIGCLCFVLMTIFRLPYAVLISVVVGITNMIPYFGPFIGAIPGAVILLLISPLKALIFIILILCLQQFDGLILGPKILGDSTGLKPLWIIIAITVGGSVGGVLGMFLGVPVVAFLRYLINRLLTYRLRERNLISGDDEPLA